MGKLVEVAKEPSAKICAAYVRVSTPQPKRIQSRRRGYRPQQENSIPRQRENLEALYRRLGYTEPLVFFVDDQSGANRNRHQWRDLIDNWIHKGRVGKILLDDDSRAGRDKLLLEEFMTLCFNRGIEVYVRAWNKAIDWRNPFDRGMVRASAMMNDMARRHLAKLSVDGTRRAFKNGILTGTTRFGYTRGLDKKFAADPVEFPILLWMKEAILRCGTGSIARELELKRREGAPQGRHSDRPWRGRDVQQILQSPVLTGCVVKNWQDPRTGRLTPKESWDIVPNAHPAAMTWEEYDLVQATIAARCSRPTGVPQSTTRTPYSGLIHCGHHKRTMTGQRHRRRQGGKWLLVCKNFNCPNNALPLSTMELGLSKIIRRESEVAFKKGPLSDMILAQLNNLQDQTRSQLSGACEELRVLAKRETVALERFALEQLEDEELKEQCDGIRVEAEALKQSAANLQAQLWVQEKMLADAQEQRRGLERICLGLENLTDSEKAALLSRTIRAISVYERNRLTVDLLAEEEDPHEASH